MDKITFTSDTLRKYFPRSYTPQRMQETIIKLLEQWQRKRQQQHERWERSCLWGIFQPASWKDIIFWLWSGFGTIPAGWSNFPSCVPAPTAVRYLKFPQISSFLYNTYTDRYNRNVAYLLSLFVDEKIGCIFHFNYLHHASNLTPSTASIAEVICWITALLRHSLKLGTYSIIRFSMYFRVC